MSSCGCDAISVLLLLPPTLFQHVYFTTLLLLLLLFLFAFVCYGVAVVSFALKAVSGRGGGFLRAEFLIGWAQKIGPMIH